MCVCVFLWVFVHVCVCMYIYIMHTIKLIQIHSYVHQHTLSFSLLGKRVNFSVIEEEIDTYWKDDREETVTELDDRIIKFNNFLSGRKEKNIIIISHSSFLGLSLSHTPILFLSLYHSLSFTPRILAYITLYNSLTHSLFIFRKIYIS